MLRAQLPPKKSPYRHPIGERWTLGYFKSRVSGGGGLPYFGSQMKRGRNRIFLQLSMLAVTDDKLVKSEVDYFIYIGKKLGFPPSFSKEVIDFGTEYIAMNKKKKRLIIDLLETPLLL